MCSIAGMIDLAGNRIPGLAHKLKVMNELQAHRGPDGNGIWMREAENVGLAHCRLSIIDIASGQQPMTDHHGNWVCFNGEIYNYIELKQQLGGTYETTSDTEVILRAYEVWGEECVEHFSGMFAFALWDEKRQTLFCARDHFGIKPFYYAVVDGVFYFASEMKTLLPFLPEVETDPEGFQDYLVFQFCMEGKTLFRGIRELEPAHRLRITPDGNIARQRYWQVYYRPDLYHTEQYFHDALEEQFQRSLKYHIRSDVPVGGYVSGGVDSSITSAIARDLLGESFEGFTGKFSIGPEYDESEYAREVAREKSFKLYEIDITAQDFIDNMGKVIYHLDTPVAGPGSFSQYMVSKLAAQHRKVVLGGQGGDEIFGGYTRYLVAYFEACIKGAIDGTSQNAPYVVTYESIIPNLTALKNYKPMLKSFWSKGLFEDSSKRYFQLIDRAPAMEDCIRRDALPAYDPYQAYERLFVAENVDKKSYLDRMTHFDFKTLLPALLHVEDRMSMAHGIESRVPFLDRELVEFAATIPANIKFKNGNMKHILRSAMGRYVPERIMDRKDKMGFPTPFALWAKGECKEFICDTLSTTKARQREYIDNAKVMTKIMDEGSFARNLWGFFCLELWQQQFHDQAESFRRRLEA